MVRPHQHRGCTRTLSPQSILIRAICCLFGNGKSDDDPGARHHRQAPNYQMTQSASLT
jgi:hypothetical protein